MKILVTGGMGYIGSHTVVELIANGHEVVIVDDLSNAQPDVLQGIQSITGVTPAFIQADISREADVAELFGKHSAIDAIIHFAASKAVGESVSRPLHYYRNNLQSLMLLLGAMKEKGIAHLVFSSSCTVYGQPEVLPVTESTPFLPAASPYGNTKQIGEEILRDTCKADAALHAISLRYFNPVGAHPSASIGELPRGVPNNLVPFITQTAAGLREELVVYGNDYDTPDGTAIRDYIHVVDLAKAHVFALERMLNNKQKKNYEFFNLGTGKGYSVLEVIHAFEQASGVRLKYRITDRRPGDVTKIYADPTLANKELGWTAEIGIEEMMRSAWKWQQHLTRTRQPRD